VATFDRSLRKRDHDPEAAAGARLVEMTNTQSKYLDSWGIRS
jgi:hypothetical protein